MLRKFKLINEDSWIGGVCEGLAYWFGFPVWIIRLTFAVAVFGYGVSILPYLFIWIFAPEWEKDPEDYHEVTS